MNMNNSDYIRYKLEADRYHIFKPIPILEVKYRPILLGISYHCKVRICISADIQRSNIGGSIYRSVSIINTV